MEPAAGRLLVAAASLTDPNFARVLVLLLNCDDEGCLGVVVNRATTTAVEAVLPLWAPKVCPPEVLYAGGPVETDSALGVATLSGRGPEPIGWRPLFESTGLVDLDTPTEVIEQADAQLRIYVGYAGWGAGQLEGEIARGDWHVVPAEPEDLYASDPDHLWGTVLRRQGGDLAWLATMPVDAQLN
ncbi:MAG: YqgE/AlgH family protein [Actinomycetota bacterium]|nr:YqgE/AlgH family protein [Actinomycetota bacterium]